MTSVDIDWKAAVHSISLALMHQPVHAGIVNNDLGEQKTEVC